MSGLRALEAASQTGASPREGRPSTLAADKEADLKFITKQLSVEGRESANLRPTQHHELGGHQAETSKRSSSIEVQHQTRETSKSQVKPPRAYCARISRAIGQNSRCYKHLVEAAKTELHHHYRDKKKDDDQRTGSLASPQMSPLSGHSMATSTQGQPIRPKVSQTEMKHKSHEELVYVRLETIGTRITDLSTQAINERLLKQLFSALFSSSSPQNGSNKLLNQTRADQLQGKEFEMMADEELEQMRAQILDLPPGLDGLHQQQNCRAAIEKTLCRFVYPSCHFRRADVSALVRPPCREDCLVLRDLYCPNLNLSKLAELVSRVLGTTLMSTLNALDLAVGGDRDALAAVMAETRIRQSEEKSSNNSIYHASHLNLNEPHNLGSRNNHALAGDGQIKLATSLSEAHSSGFKGKHTQNNRSAFGDLSAKEKLISHTSEPNSPGLPGSASRQTQFQSIHFYWPHERALGQCESLPPLRPVLLLADAVNAHNIALNYSNSSSETFTYNNSNNTNTNAAKLKHNNNDIDTEPASGASTKSKWHETTAALRRWRQRARTKWPICSNAYLTETDRFYFGQEPDSGHEQAQDTKLEVKTTTLQPTRSQINSRKSRSSFDQKSQLEESPSKACLRSSNGFEYSGENNKTHSGLDCQHWQAQWPHKHSTSELLFDNMKNAYNFCRNPGGLKEKPWCYTTSLDVRWQYCQIDFCHPQE